MKCLKYKDVQLWGTFLALDPLTASGVFFVASWGLDDWYLAA